MIIFAKYGCLLLVVCLTACNSGSSGPSEEEQLKAIQDQTTTYFLYQSDRSSIKAIDIDNPSNPIIIEPTNTTLAGVTAAPTAIPFGQNPEKSYVVNNTLVYAKDGRLWIIDNLSTGNITPRQLSSEDNSYNLCYSSLNTLDPDERTHTYSYLLPGADNTCYSGDYYQDPNNNNVWLPQLTDDIQKWVPLNASITTNPTESTRIFSYFRSDSILFRNFDPLLRNYFITGLLALDESGNLVWFEGTNFSAPTHTVASGVSSLSLIEFGKSNPPYSSDWVYLVVNNELVSYEAGAVSLSISYYSLPSGNFDWKTYGRYQQGYFYATVGQNLLKLNTVTPGAPTLEASHPYFDSVSDAFWETDSHLFLEINLTDQVQAISFNKYNGNIVNLFRFNFQTGLYPHHRRYVIGGKFYFSDDVTLDTKVVDETGNEINSFQNTFIFSMMQSAVSIPDKDPRTHLLLADYGTGTLTNLYVLDTTSNSIISHIGSIPYVSHPSFSIDTHYNGRSIFALFDNGVRKNLFFADLFLDNSLTQITDSTTDDRPITSLPSAVPPPPPGIPPPPPAAPPPPVSLPPPGPPPPAPPPPPPSMGMGGGGLQIPPPPPIN